MGARCSKTVSGRCKTYAAGQGWQPRWNLEGEDSSGALKVNLTNMRQKQQQTENHEEQHCIVHYHQKQ
eukprot:3992826-Amphidinium_carterae.1